VSGAQERIPTYISGLDENMQGGIPKGHIVLLAGVSGSMKSSLGFSMLYNAVMEGKTSGIYVTLEQGKDSLGTHMAGMGMDVQDPRVRSSIAIIDLADLRVQLDSQGMSESVDWMGQLIKQLANYRDSIGFEVVVFDSLGAFFTLTKMENPRDEVFRFFEAIRRMGLTGIVICEMMGESKNQYGEFGIEDYLSDGVIHLTMERTGDIVERKVSIVKMRHTNHVLGYQPYRWDSSNSRFTVN
jgi:circadian clock protein KaiC|tara:strand:+ start:1758 stop:2480 length:723 start_codon:yes stop_codon:yes gene_type:complete